MWRLGLQNGMEIMATKHIYSTNLATNFLIGFEVDKPSKIFIKTSNVIEYVELDFQNIKALRTDDLIIQCV